MSEACASISDDPWVIHSATALAMPGASLIQIAAADHNPLTSGDSPRIGIPSGVSDSSPLMASFTPTFSSPTMLGNSSSASSSCGSKSSLVNGSIVGDRAEAAIEGIASGSMRIARWAYEPTSKPVPCWRSYMLVSMSRTIGKVTSPVVCSKMGTGPMSIIWWTAGVSGIDAPAMAAIRGLHTPQAMTMVSVRMSPLSVRTPAIRPSLTSMPVTSVCAETVRTPLSWAAWRISVPASSESTTPTPGV